MGYGRRQIPFDASSPPPIGDVAPDTGNFTKIGLDTGTIAASDPASTITQTWNNVAVAFKGLVMDIISTASAVASRFIDYQISGTTKFAVRKDGAVVIGGDTNSFAGLRPSVGFGGRNIVTLADFSGPTSVGAKGMELYDTNASEAAGTRSGAFYETGSGPKVVMSTLGMIQWSTNTSDGFSGTGPTIRIGANTPEGAVTAAIGSIFFRTNGGANTTLYVKESGAGNTGWVAK
jgi:hypothetical protein